MSPDPQQLLTLTAQLAGLGIGIQTLEVLANAAELRDDGLLGWRPGPGRFGAWARLPRRLNYFPGCIWVLRFRALLAALAVFVPYGGAIAAGVLGLLLIVQLYYNRRFTMIAGNCETLFLVCIFAAWVGTLPGGSVRLRSVALLFIALQVAIAYAVAGFDKLRTPTWRNGARLLQIVRDGSYHLSGPARHLGAKPWLARVLAWTVIGLELLLAGAVLVPEPIFGIILAAGLCLHAMIAFAMGLHGFWWAFASAYPSLWFTHAAIYRH